MEMRNIVLFVIFILMMVFIQLAQGQSVDDVINKYIDARGGKDKLTSIQSIYMEGSRQLMGTEVEVKVTKVQGKLYRNDFEFAGNNSYIIATPAEGWIYVPMRSQKAEPMTAERLKIMQTDLDIPGPLIDYAAKGNKVELSGKEDVDGKESYKIKLTTSAGREITYYIDTKTDLLIQSRQMSISTDGNGKEKEVITNYSDYKDVEGVMFPHTLTTPGTGPAAGSITFDLIELNKKIDDNQFKPSN